LPIIRETEIDIPALGPGLIMGALRGFDEISTPFAYDVDFLSENVNLKAADALGMPAVVTVKGAPDRVFHGLIAEFALAAIRPDNAAYRLRVVPWLWFLSRRRDNRIFQNKSVIEIVEEVCKPYPHQKIEKKLQKTYKPREYCVQYGETDLDFVQRLLEHEGIFYYFDHAAGDHTMVLVDANAALKPAEGAEKLPYAGVAGRVSGDWDHVDSWAPRSAVMPGRFAHTDYDFEKPSSDLMSKSAGPRGHAGDGQEHYDYPGNYVDHARGDKLSAIRLEEITAPHVRVRAEATAPNLWAGRTFTFEDFPAEAENGDYIVLRADYTLNDPRMQGENAPAEHTYRVSLTLAPLALPFRPERRTRRSQMKGPQTAVVVGPAGAEIFTDEYARVKVQFHWDRQGKKDENTTCMIRVSQTWAGAGWGFIQIPRIGQEVIVDFLEGDPDQPIITGRVYNAEQVVPYGLPANATQSGWKSNSSPGGGGFNELRFEDKKGSEEVYFQAEKDHNELVKNDESRTIGHDFSEDVGNDAQQSIGHDRTESVGHDKSVTVGNNRTVSIGVNDDETVGSNRSLTVGSNETISVGSNSTETIGANHSQTVAIAQTITVGAARVDTVGASETRSVGAAQTNTIGATRAVTVGSSQTHSVGSDDTWSIGAKQNINVASDQTQAIGGAQNETVAKDQALTVSGARFVKVSKDQSHDVAGKVGMKVGKSYTLEAADSITLKTGSAAITMKKDGTINIEGKNITIKGSGDILTKATGQVTVKGSKINNN
jgi:type VI secretion system secreted protein VgrG